MGRDQALPGMEDLSPFLIAEPMPDPEPSGPSGRGPVSPVAGQVVSQVPQADGAERLERPGVAGVIEAAVLAAEAPTVMLEDLPVPAAETLIRPEWAQDTKTWKVAVCVKDLAGAIIAKREATGVIKLRYREDLEKGDIRKPNKNPDDDKVKLSDYDLLLEAMDKGFLVADELEEQCGLVGSRRVVEANTKLNGVLKVSMGDWLRSGSHFQPDSKKPPVPRFPYAIGAWVRLSEILPAGMRSGAIAVRWLR